jgi:hypothetical protein
LQIAINRHLGINNHPRSGWLEYSCCNTCRRQEKTEARWGFDVALAVAPGLGKNPPLRFTGKSAATSTIAQFRFVQ